MPVLIGKIGDEVKVFELQEGHPMFIGRAKECDVFLDAPGVSRRHAVLVFKKDICGIKDLGSSNGTFLNGKIIDQPQALIDGDIVSVGSFHLRFRLSRGTTTNVIAAAATAPAISAHLAAAGERENEEETAPEVKRAAVSDTVARTFPGKEQPVEGTDTVMIPKGTNPEAARQSMAGTKPTSLVLPRAMTGGQGDVSRQGVNTRSIKKEASDSSTLITAASFPNATQAEAHAAPRNEVMPEATVARKPPIPEARVMTAGEPSVDPEAIIPMGVPTVSDEPTRPPPSMPKQERHRTSLVPTVASQELNGPVAASAPVTGFYDVSELDNEVDESGDEPPVEMQPTGDDATAETVAVSKVLRNLVEKRLISQAAAMEIGSKRRAFRSRLGVRVNEKIEVEISRQDRELENPPLLEQLEKRQQEIVDRQRAYLQAVGEAERDGLPIPKDIPEEMRTLESLALEQIKAFGDSHREHLPGIFRECQKLVPSEPLVRIFAEAGIDANEMYAGAIYYLALESLKVETRAASNEVQEHIRKLGGVSDTPDAGFFDKLGKLAKTFASKSANSDKIAELSVAEKNLAQREVNLTREINFVERFLVQEYWRIYGEVAVRFIPEHEEMPVEIRAYLRHGAIGFGPLWMKNDVKEYIVSNCSDVSYHLVMLQKITQVVYADEYLAAVMNMECTPAPDDRIALLDKNSLEWKSDRAFRRLIGTRVYTTLLQELIENLDVQISETERSLRDLEVKLNDLSEIPNKPASAKKEMMTLQLERQSHIEKQNTLVNLADRLETVIMVPAMESADELDERFQAGELVMPSPEQLLRRECETLYGLSQTISGSRERFIAFAIREHFAFRTDGVTTRRAVATQVERVEQRDPSIFMTQVVPSKKKTNRVELRLSPITIIIPATGLRSYCCQPREGTEGGRMVLPTRFTREGLFKKQISALMADFRWESSTRMGGRDLLNSDTLAGAFMRIRQEWKAFSKEKRDRGLIVIDQAANLNWRRVYDAYLQDAQQGAKQIFLRNPECYNEIIVKFFELPEGVEFLKKG